MDKLLRGFLYNLNTQKPLSLAYPLIFIYRRLLLVLAFFLYPLESAVSWTLLISSWICIHLYLLTTKPFFSRLLFYQELFNELMTFYIAVFMCHLTDYIFNFCSYGMKVGQLMEIRETAGWIIIVLMTLMVLVNIVLNVIF